MNIAFLPKYRVMSSVLFTPITLFLQHLKTGELKVFDQNRCLTYRTQKQESHNDNNIATL